jgi:hypothetical protein
MRKSLLISLILEPVRSNSSSSSLVRVHADNFICNSIICDFVQLVNENEE